MHTSPSPSRPPVVPGAVAALLGLLLSSCVTIRTVNDGIARARLGETARAGALAIAPTGLVEDSRCPARVQCIRAGTVRIMAEVDGRHTELELGHPLATAGGTLALVEVYPGRREGVTLYPDEYRFGFRWERAR